MTNKILEAQLRRERSLLDGPDAKPINRKWLVELLGEREAKRVDSEVLPIVEASSSIVEDHMAKWDAANQPPDLSPAGQDYWNGVISLARAYAASRTPSTKFKLPKFLNRPTPLQRYRNKWAAKEYGLVWKFQELPASEQAKFICPDDPRYGEGKKYSLVLHLMPYYIGDWIEHQRTLERSRATAERSRIEAHALTEAQKAALDRAVARETNPGIPIVGKTQGGFKVKSDRQSED